MFGVRSTENQGQVVEVRVACKWTCRFVLCCFLLVMYASNELLLLHYALILIFFLKMCVLFTTTVSVFLFSPLFGLLDVNLLDRRSSITM